MISTILHRIDNLFQNDMIHKKRGYHISNQNTEMAGLALVEETVELQAELMAGTDDTVLEEMADVLICLTRVIYDRQILPVTLLTAVEKKLDEIWVYGPDAVETGTPGLTRRNRIDG